MTESKTSAPAVKATAAHMRAALSKAHPTAEYVVLFEVQEGTGGSMGRRADAIIQSLWPSRGLELMGFEIKVSRADWLGELKDPSKAERIAQFCERWTIVAPPGVVKVAEMPATWGLWEVNPETLAIKRTKQAPLNENALPPTKAFFASLLRARAKADAAEQALWLDTVQKAADKEARKRFERYGEGSRSRSVDEDALKDAQHVLNKVEEVKALTGINLLTYKPAAQIARAIQFANSTAMQRAMHSLGYVINDADLRAGITELLGDKV